jgi:hypothetical protein
VRFAVAGFAGLLRSPINLALQPTNRKRKDGERITKGRQRSLLIIRKVLA